MSDWHDELRYRRSVITLRPIAIPVLWLAFALSLSIHVVALLRWIPKLELTPPATETQSDEGGIAVQLQPAQPPVVAQVQPQPQRQAQAQPSEPAPAAREAPPPPRRNVRPVPPRVAMTTPPVTPPLPTPAPALPVPPVIQPPSPPTPPAPEPQAPDTPIAGDLASYIASRRRARGAEPEGSTPPEDEKARRDRVVAANLASVNSRNFNDGPRHAGGVFQILSITFNEAEFAFFGWNRDIRQRANMRIEVRRTPEDGDIQHAVVRKMIAIIRDYEVEDFTWESRRLGRNVTLSARKRDTEELEAFLMREFFDDKVAR